MDVQIGKTIEVSSNFCRVLPPQQTLVRGEAVPLGEASHKPLRKGSGRKLIYLKQLKHDLLDYNIENVTTAAKNREVCKNLTRGADQVPA